ncbi:MAG: RNA polymerase sigma-54 factor [Clostridiales bacterium]|nr:RNA polymerase factor sigma-54 [Bacillota bacterium]MEE0517742.1 RNA polymerase factor sigma-54 [Anaerovoracaceae bacterium]PWL94749.1 MAG: RNA polymerase sigma-54 factor [Clostridiales bacterium]
MKLSYGLTIEQTQKLTMTPELIQAIRILQFSTQELDSFVQEELLENPVLEIDGKRKDDKTVDIDIQEKIKEDYNDEESYKQWERSSDREEYSYEQFVSKEETLEDSLLLQLTFSKLKGHDLKIGRYIVEAIDENGYLTTPVEQIAAIFKTDSGKIDAVLDVIQTFEPVGVGARNLKECLIIQLAAKGLLDEVTEYIILNHLEDLGNNKLNKIAKTVGIPVTQVQMIGDLIRTLEPKPGRSFAGGESVKYIVPDVFVEKMDDEYVVTNNESSVPHIMVSPYYNSLAREAKNDEELSKYITDKFNAALWLIKSIEQRKRTIYNVASAVVQHQKEFFDKGTKYLKTLTLKEVADGIGMHESTVSRSVNGKYMQTPRGVFEIKYFFSGGITGQDGTGVSSNSIKTIIKEIIDGENPSKPYSDQDIVGILSEKGIEISRRTVAKYREGMNILSSSKRRRY